MANNNFKYTDPNKEGNGFESYENLNIEVQLTATRRGRKNQETEVIKFIDGTIKNSDGTKSLSTNFTEIGTNFGKDNKLETLGIKSIDIDFNASYTPMVKITFIDLRGDSIISRGNDSKYNFFFELPYPVFGLTIKGYYGKAVTYCLNMTKFNTKFNSDSGHFEINCEFIGYTYAFLSDMLMGYMKAITNTDKGKELFNSIAASSSNGVTIPTLSDFIAKADKLNTNLEKVKNEGEYQVLAKANEVKEFLENIKNYIVDTVYKDLSNIEGVRGIGTTINTGDVNNILLFVTNFGQSSRLNSTAKNASIFDKLKRKIEAYNKKSGTKFLLDVEKVTKVIGSKVNVGVHTNLVIDNNKLTNFKDFNIEADKLLVNSGSIKSEGLVYDFTALITEINSRITEVSKEIENSEKKVTNLTSDIVESTFDGFTPTIKNLILMLVTHAEVLIKSINDVANNIVIDGRPLALRNAAKDGKISETDGDSVIYPFPTYSSDKVTQSWIGELDSTLPEVKFIEELFEALIRVERSENLLLNGGSVNSYLPVNAYDSYITNNNPYFKLNDTSEVKDAVIMMILRATTFLLTSVNGKKLNDSELNDVLTAPSSVEHLRKEVELVGRVEARNMVNSILFDTSDKNKVFDYLESLGSTSEEFYNSVKDLITRDGLITDSDTKDIFVNSMFKYDNNSFTYQFLTDDESGLQLIPFSNDLRSREINKSFKRGEYNESDGTEFVNLLSKGSKNSFSITTINDTIVYNFPELPDDNQGNEIVSNSGYPKLRDLTVFGKYNTETVFKFNLGNKTGSNNEITIYGGENEAFKYRTFNNYKIEGEDTNISSLYLYYYNVKEQTSPSIYDSHITGVGLHRTSGVRDYEVSSGITQTTNLITIKYDENHLTIVDDPFFDGYEDDTFSWYTTFRDNSISDKILKSTRDVDNEEIIVENIYLNNASLENFSFKLVKPISLFGSEFYNKQTSDRAKSLLFLNSLQLRVGEDLDILISSLLNRQGGLVKVPKMLMVLLGGMLWRSTQNEDPILFYKDINGNLTNQRIINGVVSGQVAAITKSGSVETRILKPELDEFLIAFKDTIDFADLDSDGNNDDVNYLYYMTLINEDKRSSTGLFNQNLSYVKLPKSITTMNLDLKQKFINEFEDWYSDQEDGWPVIKSLWEITKDNSSDTWETAINNNDYSNDNYQVMSKIVDDDDNIYNSNNVNVIAITNQNRTDGVLSQQITSVASSYTAIRYIINSVPQVWNTDKTLESGNNALIKEENLKTYIESFYTELIKLKKVKDEELENEKNSQSLNSKELVNLKLNTYRNIKSIHDKWLGDENMPYSLCTDLDNLFDSFKIIDKYYNNIGDKVIVNPKKFIENILGGSNTSLASFLSKFLASMNFDFIALPNFIDLNDEKEIKQMFQTFDYSENAPVIGPSFICMYVGDFSKNLNLGKNNPKNDGSDVKTDRGFASSELVLPGTAFLVKYGQQNQSIFKSLELNQQEFSESDESLYVTDSLARPNSIKNAAFLSQSLFNIYSTRSYNCGLSMMGNAMVQPMTYFNLENVPMFSGAYLIKHVKHSIKANSMETHVVGNRISNRLIPYIDSNTIYLNLLGSIKNLTNNASLTSTIERSGSFKQFGDNAPKEIVDGVQTIDSVNSGETVLDKDSQNGVIYV